QGRARSVAAVHPARLNARACAGEQVAAEQLGPVGEAAHEVADRAGRQARGDALTAGTDGGHGVDGIVRRPMPDVKTTIDALRERAARLDTVEEPAGEGDFVVMDYAGSIDGEPFEGGEGRDQLLELGSGRLIPGFEEQLTGAAAGDERTVDVTFPDDYGAG